MQENAPSLWQIPPLVEADHKYTRGHTLLLGSSTMTGAAKLAALAAQRAGAGLVTLASPEAAWPIYAASMMSVITTAIADTAAWHALAANPKVTSIAIGPGLTPETAIDWLAAIAPLAGKGMVIDAGAIATVADRHIRPYLVPERWVITPHEGEYTALAQALDLPIAAGKADRAARMASELDCIVVLKGADTIIAHPSGRVVLNHARAPWLATGGTGDVLAGLIAGLAAQGMNAFDAACAGVWLHSEAARSLGRGMVAEDLLAAVPPVLRRL